MGYCARDGSGDGKAHYFPRVDLGPVIDHVADANARLSLTAEGVVVSGGTTCDGLYTQRAITNGKPSYNLSSKPTTVTTSSIYWSSGAWGLIDGSSFLYSSSNEDVPLPSDVDDWSDPGHGNPTPVVTHSPGQVTGAGYQVIQDSDGLTYTFGGDGSDADAGLRVTGSANVPWNIPYQSVSDGHGGFSYSDIPSGSTFVITEAVAGLGAWMTSDGNYAINTPQAYPWQDAWIVATGTPPPPTVIRNPIASLANWTP